MRKNKFIFERVGLKVFEIVLKDGTIHKNYPNRGDNLATADSLKEFLLDNDWYFLTLGNNRRITIRRDEIKEIR